MSLEEIILIIISVGFVLLIFGKEIYRMIKKKPSKACVSCSKNIKKALNDAKKALACKINN